MPVLTVVAMERGGFFAPALRMAEREAVRVFYLKSPSALNKLKKISSGKAVAAPSAQALPGIQKLPSQIDDYLYLLAELLPKKARLPLDELFISASPERAAKIIGLIPDSARLFTVISPSELPSELFDSLYFNKGIILRRIGAPGSRVGRRALCLREGGRAPLGVETVELASLGRTLIKGGPLDFLSEVGIEPTAGLYRLANIPVPEGSAALEEGREIFYLDIG